MPENLIFTEKEEAFLRELVGQDVEFMVVGLAAATLQGAPAVTQDIDLWFKNLGDPRIREALRNVGGIYVPPFGLNPPMFAGENVALFDIALKIDGLESFDAECRKAITIPLGNTRVRVLPLDRIIASKRAANRPKDRLALPVLEDAVLAIREKEKRTSP